MHCLVSAPSGPLPLSLSHTLGAASHALGLPLSHTSHQLLDEITIIDTPGVLSGEKQRIERNYNVSV